MEMVKQSEGNGHNRPLTKQAVNAEDPLYISLADSMYSFKIVGSYIILVW